MKPNPSTAELADQIAELKEMIVLLQASEALTQTMMFRILGNQGEDKDKLTLDYQKVLQEKLIPNFRKMNDLPPR